MPGDKESYISEFDSYNSSTNGDGYLTTEELKALNLTEDAQEMIMGYDLNGDNKISKNEYLFSKLLAAGETSVTKGQLIDAYGDAAAELLSYDENKDGVITKEEAGIGEARAAAARAPAIPISKEDAISQFKLLDNATNSDGYLTEQELRDLGTVSETDLNTIMGFDANGDKKISRNEYLFSQVLKDGETSITKGQLIDAYGEDFANNFLKECDLDGDGKVSKAEIITVEDTKRYNQPTEQSNDQSNSGGLSTASIVLISVACCMLVGLVIALILFLIDKNSSREANKRRLDTYNSIPSTNLTTAHQGQEK